MTTRQMLTLALFFLGWTAATQVGGWIGLSGGGLIAAEGAAPAQAADLRFGLRGAAISLPVWVDAVEPSGTIQAAIDTDRGEHGMEASRILARTPITEGYYLGVIGLPMSFEAVSKFTNGSYASQGLWILRIQILELREEGKFGGFTARIAPEAAEKLRKGESFFLLRPAESTTAQMQAVPGLVPIVDQRAGHPGVTPELLAHRVRATENLKKIAVAMHTFHEKHKHFPPAVVYGPDGKPWHSWRVLILPYLGQQTLYDQYRMDEPWDGPNNQKLLTMIPDCYQDPVYGRSAEPYAHYAAIVGPGCAFRSEPRRPLDFLPKSSGLTGATTAQPDFRDGVSQAITIGSIHPERKVPWTKPEDVAWRDDLPPPGSPDSFAAPHRAELGVSGIFAFTDASVRPVSSDLDPASFRHWLQIADGRMEAHAEPPKRATIAVLEIPQGRAATSAKLILAPPPLPLDARR